MALMGLGEQSHDLHLRKVWLGQHGAKPTCPQFVRDGIERQDAEPVRMADDASLHSFNAASGLEPCSRPPIVSKVLIQ